MAKKSQQDPLPPQQSSSDEEEQESGSEEEQESGSESDPNPTQPQKTQSDDSASDESDDDDSQANIPTVVTKPISSKPMKNANKPNPEAKATKKDDLGKKRASSEEGEKESKKAKKTDEEDSKKPLLFQRLFSEEDELVILQSVIDYKNENGINGEITDMAAFYEIVRKLLRVEFTKAQLADKIRRLKRKFNNNLGRELKLKKGKTISFSRSNEREGYELSKMIWGSGASSSAPNGVADTEVLMTDVDNSMGVDRFVKYGGSNGGGPVMVEEIVKAGMEMVDDAKRKEWEARWKMLKLQELELYAKRTDLVQEHVAVVIKGVKSSAI